MKQGSCTSWLQISADSHGTLVQLSPICAAAQHVFVCICTVFVCVHTCSDSSDQKYHRSCQQSSKVFMAVMEHSGPCCHYRERLQHTSCTKTFTNRTVYFSDFTFSGILMFSFPGCHDNQWSDYSEQFSQLELRLNVSDVFWRNETWHYRNLFPVHLSLRRRKSISQFWVQSDADWQIFNLLETMTSLQNE